MGKGTDLALRRKLSFRAEGKRLVLVKKPVESIEHVLMKAFLWALYLPDYPDLRVEVPIGHRYKPDVTALDAHGRPRFWGEAGKVSLEKLERTAARLPHTHFAFAKWAAPLRPFHTALQAVAEAAPRTAPLDLIRFPPDSAERFLEADGEIRIRREDLEWARFGAV